MPGTKPPRATSSADLNAIIERVTPDVLALLAGGMPRTEAAVVAALAGRHPRQGSRMRNRGLGWMRDSKTAHHRQRSKESPFST
jgi:hypothetical protein